MRLGELVFHGKSLGASHPDVIAHKAVAVLFDEKEEDLKSLLGGDLAVIRFDIKYSGGKCIALTRAGMAFPAYQPPFGHALPNWDFPIVEKPEPGQYRWLQFAWKATSPQTTGMSLLLSKPWPTGGYNICAGTVDWPQGVLATKTVADKPPTDWQVVRRLVGDVQDAGERASPAVAG